jgi:DNA-binding NarL/FixJ family response regulator
MASQKDATTLLVGRPGPLRDALQSLVSTMPDLAAPVTADTGLLALKTIREAQPRLILVGSGLPEAEVLELLRQIKETWPDTACLVLVESTQQRRSALAAGADQVLSVGVPSGEIFSAIRQVLEHRA